MADLIFLKFSLNFDHCPRFMLSFHSTNASLSLAFYNGSNYVLRKPKWSKWMKLRNLNLALIGALEHVKMPCNT